MSVPTATMTEVLRRQLEPALQMLSDIVEICPDSTWLDARSGRPFWQHVIHALTSVRFWFREATHPFSPPDFGRGPVPDLDQTPAFPVDRETVRDYVQTIRNIVEVFFETLNDDGLLAASSIYDKSTYADLVLGQIRHLQHHTGYLNCLLQTGGAKPAKWQGYEE